MIISFGSIKACHSITQRTRLASSKRHVYSTDAFISCTYQKTAISANIDAASDYTLFTSLRLPPFPRVIVVGRAISHHIWSSCHLTHAKDAGIIAMGAICMLCLMSVRRIEWLNYKEWCTEAAEVSCSAAEPCNETFTSKSECGAKKQMVCFWILLFICLLFNPG